MPLRGLSFAPPAELLSAAEIETVGRAAVAAGFRRVRLTGGEPTLRVELAALTLTHDWHVRFIELMPLGRGDAAAIARRQFVSNRDTRRLIEGALGALTPLPSQHPADESKNFRLPEARGVVGFISPVSEPYCGTCNRMRLTADGKFHLCLLNDDELDVKRAIRSGGGIEAVCAILLRAVAAKPTGHALHRGHSTENRDMYQLGG
jgi:cyclic pyranopterin phosphate synthase